MPPENVPYTDAALAMARCYYQTHHAKKGDEIVSSLLRRSEEWLSWIEGITPARRPSSRYSRYTWLQAMQLALSTAVDNERNEIFQQYSNQYEQHIKLYQQE
jgi:hypothetical protein